MTVDSDDQRQQLLEALRGAWREHIENETPYKIEAADILRPVLVDVLDGRADWSDLIRLKRDFLNNQLGWRIVAELETLAKDHPEPLREAVRSLLDDRNPDSFFRSLDARGVDLQDLSSIRGAGSRTTLASFFLLIDDPERHPIYRARNTGAPLEALLGQRINVGEPSERLERYYRGLDRLAELLHDEQGGPRHRLDTQGALWISKGYGLGIIDDASADAEGSEVEEGAAGSTFTSTSSNLADRLRASDVRAYKIAPGHRGSEWDDCLAGGYICIGWDEVGDLDQYPSRDAFIERFDEVYPYNGNLSASHRKAGELWTAKELKPGDLVIANRGISEVLAIGAVTEEGYRYRPDREAYRHTVGVDWDTSYATTIPRLPYWATATVTRVDRRTLEVILGERRSYVQTWMFQLDLETWQDIDFLVAHQEGDRLRLPAPEHGHAMRRGDRALVWKPRDEAGLYAIGELRDDAQGGEGSDETAAPFAELELTSVLAEPLPESLFRDEAVLSQLEVLEGSGGADFRIEPQEWEAIRQLLEGAGPPTGVVPALPDVPVRPLAIDEIASRTGLSSNLLSRWVRALERKGQAILYGPPGTGKTFVADLLARHVVGGGDGILELVQFHPAYAYEDFMQGLRPVSEEGELAYRMVPGRFLDFIDRARGRAGTSVLILDEINRADLARVFGELMYLLEYRKKRVPLAGGGSLSISSNVRILGTMNTADRSIALVDHALRRRFAFLRLDPKLDVLKNFYAGGPDEDLARSLAAVLADLHDEIDDPNLAIGISYFLLDDLTRDLEDVWRMEIEPYLEELFFDRSDPIGRFAWPQVAARLELA